ncbi:MAG TPA: Ig-like domain-containing protein [Verrucomicrobiae bacterium]|nr:Ig-like domain-containing protein [Verrucomicrobiae bacterium]
MKSLGHAGDLSDDNLNNLACDILKDAAACAGAGPCLKAAIGCGCGGVEGAEGGPIGAAAGCVAGAGLDTLSCLCQHLPNISLPVSVPPDPGPAITGGGGGGGVVFGTGGGGGSIGGASYTPWRLVIDTGNNCSGSGPEPAVGGKAPGEKTVRRVLPTLSPPKLEAPVPAAASGGVCAHVRLEIDQDVVLTRTAFKGTLEINNGGDHAIDNIQVSLDFRNGTNGAAADKFVVEGPALSALHAVDGTGTLDGGATGLAVYTFVPTLDAAPYEPETFQIGGTLSYTDNGQQVTVPLLSAPITVYPEAKLNLAYFQQRDVYGDDPFTPQVEPSEPFTLGLLVENVGAGMAHRFTITTAQPKIVDNEKGLLINFSIIGTKVGDFPISPSLTGDLGDIAPGGVKEITWDMLSTLQGKFISFDATFQHINDLGATNTSLINSVEIHELIHKVLANRTLQYDGAGTNDDDVPDFLVNDIPDPGHLPDALYLSEGAEAPVNVITNAAINGAIGAGHLQSQLTATVSNGWNYIQAPDPGPGFLLQRVVRSDGKVLSLTNNAWTTDRSFPASSTSAVRENLLHLFDWAGSGDYTLYYRSTNTTPPAIVQLGPVTPFIQPGAVSAVHIVFSEPVDLVTFDAGTLTLTRNGGANLIGPGSGVTVTHVSGATYSINGLDTLTAADGNYQLTVNGSGIDDLWGNNAGNVLASAQWTLGNAPVVVETLDAVSPNPRNFPVPSVNVTFSRAINPATFDYHALSLTRNGGANLITSGVTITPVSGNTYSVGGLNPLTGTEGDYALTVDAGAVQDSGGVAGFGSATTTWTMVTTGPRIVALEQLAANPRNIVVQSLNVTFAQPVDPATFDYHDVTLSRNGGANLITSDVTVSPVNATTYKIANFNWVVGQSGTYAFTVDASGIADLAGNAGAGSTNETWQMILETPPSPTNLVITPDTGVSAMDGLTATNAVVLSGTIAATDLTVRVFDLTSDTDLGVATVDGTNFSKALNFAVDGRHQLQLIAVDVAGNVSAPSESDLFVDTTPPTATIQSVSPNPTPAPVTSLQVTFSKAINTNTVSAANFTLTRDGTNTFTPAISIVSSNAVLVTGLETFTAPAGVYDLVLNLSGIQDLAGNTGSGSATTDWVTLPPNQPPSIVQEPNAAAQPGQPFQRLIQASDPDGNHITFSLDPSGPSGAFISANGLFIWTPTCEQGGTTNLITVWATDDGVPPASNSMSFVVTVGDCLQIGIGSTVAQVGTTASVPVTVFSSAGVTNLRFTLAYPANRFTNWMIVPSNSVVGASTAQALNPSHAVFNLAARDSGSFQGSGLLGSLFFSPLPAHSAFVPLIVTNAVGIESGNTPVGSIQANAGQVVVIGTEPLLEARLGTNAERQLVLYGNPGASYQIAYSTNLMRTNWASVWRVPMTNLFQEFGPDNSLRQAFYRAWQFTANPPLLELHLLNRTNTSLLLYGQNGTNYVIETTTNLSPGALWQPVTNFVLSNSFQFIQVSEPTNPAMFFRARP